MHRGRLPLITYALSRVCLAQHTFMVCRSALCERHASSSVLPSFARLPSLLRAAPQKSTKASTSASSTGASPRSAAANEAARATSCGGCGRAAARDCLSAPWGKRGTASLTPVRAWGRTAHWTFSRARALGAIPGVSYLDLSLRLFLRAQGAAPLGLGLRPGLGRRHLGG